jgi:hypothetical protein
MEFFVLKESDLPEKNAWLFLEENDRNRVGGCLVYTPKGLRNRGKKCVAFDLRVDAEPYAAFLTEEGIPHERFNDTTLPKHYHR